MKAPEGLVCERRSPLEEAEPIPSLFEHVRQKAAALAGVEPRELVEALVATPKGHRSARH
jgi:hypothetical protein